MRATRVAARTALRPAAPVPKTTETPTRCPVCAVVTGSVRAVGRSGWPTARREVALYPNASGYDDGYRCRTHARTVEERLHESMTALKSYERGELARGAD